MRGDTSLRITGDINIPQNKTQTQIDYGHPAILAHVVDRISLSNASVEFDVGWKWIKLDTRPGGPIGCGGYTCLPD